MKGKIIASVLVTLIWSFVEALINPSLVLGGGKLAGLQMDSSDTAFMVSQVGGSGLGYVDFGVTALSYFDIGATAFLLISFLVIWLPNIKNWAERIGIYSLAIMLVLGSTPQPAYAYFSSTERSEAYTILPNQSAIWIPDVGDNKNSQVQLNSEAYYNANKVSAKRFVVPHHKFQNSGGWIGWDAYVPDGRLIIVDRTQFSREWVAGTHKGTSQRDESIPCQSQEGLNISVGISIGAEVAEENAAKFLYHFGVVSPQGDPSSGEVIFASVYHSRNVSDVMDNTIRPKIQTLICNQLASRSFDDANKDATKIMDKVEADTRAYLESVGITLKFLGWADTFTFDPLVQKAINDAYIASKLAPYAGTLNALAAIQVQEGVGRGVSDKGLPFVVTPNLLSNILGISSSTLNPQHGADTAQGPKK